MLNSMLTANGYKPAVGEEPADSIDRLPSYLPTLPAKVKRRLQALKKNQKQVIELEAEFYRKVHILEKEFENQFSVVFEERRKIVSGEREPADDECELPVVQDLSEAEKTAFDSKTAVDGSERGVPGFWLNVLKNAEGVGEMIQENDEPLLNSLLDVSSTIELDPPGFTLHFAFAENAYFANTVLTKRYQLQVEPDAEDVFDYDGPIVSKAEGCVINWKDGKNVTRKVVKKRAKKGSSKGQYITKTVKTDSFFNFFDPPEESDAAGDDDDDADSERDALLHADYEIGQILRDQVIPRATLVYTGEALAEDAYDDDDFEDAENGDDDDDDDDEE